MTRAQKVEDGVRDAFDFWLSQHDVSVPDALERAIKEAFGAWLRENEEQIMQRIADRREADWQRMMPLIEAVRKWYDCKYHEEEFDLLEDLGDAMRDYLNRDPHP